MRLSSAVKGAAWLTLGGAAFAYYTLWVLVAPAVENDLPALADALPPRFWALALPATVLTAVTAAVAATAGWALAFNR